MPYSCFRVKGILCFDWDCKKRVQCNPATDINHARFASDEDTALNMAHGEGNAK
ncbi:Uncharacterised protein [uncultured archaeon]|nr:Uncharacterised protein [uncultured archaeon]